MRILVTGASGMLGSTIVTRWQGQHELYATGGADFTAPSGWRYRPFDLAAERFEPLCDWAQPEGIVHCAAMTAVDACEAEPARAMRVNGESVARLLAAAPRARVLYVSSDAVLGAHDGPADEDTTAAPLSAYGRSKRLGEELLGAAGLSVRTTVVGWNLDPGKQSFIEWMTRSLRRGQPITLFHDALFNPIAARLFADEIEGLLSSTSTGVCHVAAHDATSKHDFGVALCERLGLDCKLISSGSLCDARFVAARVADQRLDVRRFERTHGRPLPTIADSIDALVRDRPNHMEPNA